VLGEQKKDGSESRRKGEWWRQVERRGRASPSLPPLRFPSSLASFTSQSFLHSPIILQISSDKHIFPEPSQSRFLPSNTDRPLLSLPPPLLSPSLRMKRNPRKVRWTKSFRKAAGKEMTIVRSPIFFRSQDSIQATLEADLREFGPPSFHL